VSADLYAAWLTAGNNLQPVGAWIARNWTNLAAAVVLAVAASVIWRALRRADRQITAIHADFSDKPTQHRTGEK
jgi:predicted negative regulator of RcsB-dependent stress response